MVKNKRDDANLQKLVKLAKMSVDEQQRRLVDLQTARSSAETSLDWLQQSVRAEEEKMARSENPDLVTMRGFVNGANEKRAALEATITTLLAEIDEARSALTAAHTEVKKLEHLLSIRQKAAQKDAAKKEDVMIGDYAARIIR